MLLTGAEMVVKCLEEHGVEVVFGYPGAANCPIIDKLSFSDIRHILTRNEQGAAHMASGYARVTKKVGVCTATSGPGATNLITGIATAYMDSVPMIILTGQVASGVIGKDAFQEVDITGATIPFTKHNYLVEDGLQIRKIMNEAFHIASTGRKGPVLIDFPMDYLKKVYEYPDEAEPVSIRGYRVLGKANEAQVKRVAEAIEESEKPLILAGGGIVGSDAIKTFRKFVNQCNIPVVATMTGIGTVPTDDELYLGMIGSHGRKAANRALLKADTVIIVGARLGDRSVYNAQRLGDTAKLIHIDIDPAEIGKNMQPYIPVVGDIKDVIKQLLPIMTEYKCKEEWLLEIKELKAGERKYDIVPQDSGYIDPKFFMDALSKKVGKDVYVSTEVGQNQIWTANYFHFENARSFITSAGFGTMGYGLPAAIGASVATEKPVVAVMGDGSFQMDLPELATMCQWNIPVKMVVFENKRLGMVHEHQYLLYKANYQAVFLDGSPDFEKLAEAYGIPSMKISENSQVDSGIDTLMSGKDSFLLIVSVDPQEPTGDALNEDLLPKGGAE